MIDLTTQQIILVIAKKFVKGEDGQDIEPVLIKLPFIDKESSIRRHPHEQHRLRNINEINNLDGAIVSHGNSGVYMQASFENVFTNAVDANNDRVLVQKEIEIAALVIVNLLIGNVIVMHNALSDG